MQNPLVRILAGVVGLALLGLFIIFGLFAVAILVAVGLFWYAWLRWKIYRARKRGDFDTDPQPPTDPDVIEGEYEIIHERRHDAD